MLRISRRDKAGSFTECVSGDVLLRVLREGGHKYALTHGEESPSDTESKECGDNLFTQSSAGDFVLIAVDVKNLPQLLCLWMEIPLPSTCVAEE